MGLKERVYAHTPPVLQSALLSAYGLLWRQRRLGGAFPRYVAEYEAREFLSAAEWERYQGDRLAALLRHALHAVPAYRRLPIRAEALHLLEAGRPFEALRRFPLLDKEALRRTPHDYVAEHPGVRLGAALTSGTTGTPLRIMASADAHRRFMAAYEARVRRWAGVSHRDRRVMIGGRLIVPAQDRRGPFWRTNWAEHQLYMSAFHIGPDTALRYAQAIVRFAPRYLVGYASALWALADELDRQGWRAPQPLAAVLTSSEPLRPDMRDTLSRVWGCAVYDGYSGVESCCLAGECAHGRLHLNPDVGVVEFMDGDGEPTLGTEPREMVATGLLNFDQPLIRYRTGDMAMPAAVRCGCGRSMPVLAELVGRVEDDVILRDGTRVRRFHSLPLGLTDVRSVQVVQESLDAFVLNVVPDGTLSEASTHALISRLQERCGGVQVEVREVTEHERTRNGKFRAVVSRLGGTPLPKAGTASG
ncbi:phenylacetate--CoA ligase family protein [Gemmatimonas sp.]|jgi:phenylacetate-CoA ligase|uniref:phenylacetate--CoA ligase family protein n=1 Tax=Gemmatimonas sp. TaxID=1962908 RepID=UPI003918DBE0